MPLFPPANVAESDRSLFSAAEMEGLMRGELYRARRYGHDLALMVIAVDRLENLHDLYGLESKQEIQHAMVELLTSVTRSSDCLGSLVDDRILALFPHTDGAGAAVIGQRLISGARKMEFESDGRVVRVTLSVGAAEASLPGIEDLDGLRRAAEGCLADVMGRGGDRYLLREEGAIEAMESGAAPARGLTGGADGPLARRVRELLMSAAEGGPIELGMLQEELVEFALKEVGLERKRLVNADASEERISLMQRRMDKLNAALASAEEELRRALLVKGVDPGIESIYRVVQGLAEDEPQQELRKILMQKIFEANLDLRDQLRDKS